MSDGPSEEELAIGEPFPSSSSPSLELGPELEMPSTYLTMLANDAMQASLWTMYGKFPYESQVCDSVLMY